MTQPRSVPSSPTSVRAAPTLVRLVSTLPEPLRPWLPEAWLAAPGRAVARLVGAFSFRLACIAGMYWLALWSEVRPAPTLPDAVLAVVPYVPWVDRWNYVLWTLAYVPVVCLLLYKDVERFWRYLIAGGLVALLRGFCIAATGLGPTRGGMDLHVGLSSAQRVEAWTHLWTPFGLFVRHPETPFYLTKDLFFSGHTASTFLLLLYVWRFPRLRAWTSFAHLLVVASVFFAHLHYTIDVLGAYAMTFTVYTLMESDLGKLLQGKRTEAATT